MFKFVRSRFFQETAAILLAAVSILIVLSLYSYFPSDPSFNKFLSAQNIEVHNSGGIVGAYLSDLLVQWFGLGAFCIPIAFAALAWRVFCEKPFRAPTFLMAGGGVGTLFFCGLLHLLFTADPFFGEKIKGGGEAGRLISGRLLTFFNYSGTLIIVVAFLIISILLATRLSIQDLLTYSKSFFLFIIQSIAKIPYSKFLILLPPYAKKDDTEKNEKSERRRELKEEKKKKREDKKREKEKRKEAMTEKTPQIGNQPTEKRKKKKKKGESEESGEEFETPENLSGEKDAYRLPPLSFLDKPPKQETTLSKEELLKNSRTLLKKLADFNIDGNIVQVLPGPVITMYEFEPGTGIKVSRILNLTDDLALAMKSTSIRIHAPVHGKSVVGIELPNSTRESVSFRDIITGDKYRSNNHKLTLALGKNTSGGPQITNLATIPHLLVAGSTGSGKSVGINCMICSILYNATPDEVKFIMIDPKMLELSIYDGIPHLIAPVVTNPKKAANALRWTVEEMERRYQLLSELGTRNVDGYNKLVEERLAREAAEPPPDAPTEDGTATTPETNKKEDRHNKKLPYIVVVIDELADLMMVASKDVEESLARIAQMARAAGIHLLVATQRPSVDVLTGLIKANFPARISFQVTSRIDSRTILDSMGAERLLGKGDMLFLPPGTSKFTRIHGAFISEHEVKRIVDFLKKQDRPAYNETILMPKESEATEETEENTDEMYDQAVALVSKTRQASISMVQRRLRIGYNRAARIIEIMEKQGLVGPADGSKPRDVYVRDMDNVESIN